jgi:hypothetical protein
LLPVFGTISGLIVDCFENDKGPIHLLYCGRLLKYTGANLTMLSIAEIPGHEGDVSMGHLWNNTVRLLGEIPVPTDRDGNRACSVTGRLRTA